MLSNFKYIYIDNKAPKTLILLHGTGADEYDLLPLVDPFKDRYNFLSLRGNVQEQGMNRFFARHGMGVFDQESIEKESLKLNEFIVHASIDFEFEISNLYYLGYSNGANMILATMFKYPNLFNKIVLLHSMMPFEPGNIDLKHIDALVTLGENDQMIPATESYKVVDTLKKLGAKVEVVTHPGGHEIRREELEAMQEFLCV